MAIQLSVGVRNARLDAIETNVGTQVTMELRSGAKPATCADNPTNGAVLATLSLPSDWMAAASGGSKALAGTWQDASADSSGSAIYFRLYNVTSGGTKDGTTCVVQGTVTATGGGGDLTLDNVSINAGQSVTITSFTLTDGNA